MFVDISLSQKNSHWKSSEIFKILNVHEVPISGIKTLPTSIYFELKEAVIHLPG